MAMTIAPYLALAKSAAHEDSANIGKVVGSVLLGIARIVLIALIYRAAYQAFSHNPLPYQNAVWSIAVYFALILGLNGRQIFRLIETAVKTGAVETELIRPVEWRAAKFCYLIGRNSLESLSLAVAFTATLLVFIGPPTVAFLSPAMIAAYVYLFVIAVVTAGAMYTTVGLSAFWLNDAKSVFRILDKTVLIFGGAFVPVALLPAVVQEVVRYSPFGVYAAVTQLFNPAMAGRMVPTLVASTVWTIVLLGLCQAVWLRAEKRVEVNGG